MHLRILSPSRNNIKQLMRQIGVDKAGVSLMHPKATASLIKINKLSTIAANILKQQLLSTGADAAVARWAITGSRKPTDCIITANDSQLSKLIAKLKSQPFGLKELSFELKSALDNYRRQDFILKARNFRIKLGRDTKLMGIINATADSFSGDGIYSNKFDPASISSLVRELINDGADIIDIGGESTRPGAKPISVKEELKRVIPLIKNIVKKVDVPLSIDTYKPEVAKACLEEGVAIVNDISGLQNKLMAKFIARHQAAVVIMHMKGRPRTMQRKIHYHCLIDEIIDYLKAAVQRALDAGIRRDAIVVDPGIGFGKTCEHNLEIINHLDEFKVLGFPILVGPSRKSFIGLILKKDIDARLFGTAAAVAVLVLRGAHIIRAHDAAQIKDVIKMADVIKNS